jgi:hypothetical protein
MKASLRLINKKGQAAAELAILGTLIIAAFAYIMTFGQSLGALQQTKMETFRRALQKAYIRNASVNYALRKDLRAASVTAGFFQGQGISPESSASLTWQKGRSGDYQSTNQGSFAFWRVNNTDVAPDFAWKKQDDTDKDLPGNEYGLPLNKQDSYSADGSKSDKPVLVPAAIYKNTSVRTEAYTFQGNKAESNAAISYSKKANLNDSTQGALYTHFNTAVDRDPGDDDTPTAKYSETENIPYGVSQTYDYESEWEVQHNTGR